MVVILQSSSPFFPTKQESRNYKGSQQCTSFVKHFPVFQRQIKPKSPKKSYFHIFKNLMNNKQALQDSATKDVIPFEQEKGTFSI